MQITLTSEESASATAAFAALDVDAAAYARGIEASKLHVIQLIVALRKESDGARRQSDQADDAAPAQSDGPAASNNAAAGRGTFAAVRPAGHHIDCNCAECNEWRTGTWRTARRVQSNAPAAFDCAPV